MNARAPRTVVFLAALAAVASVGASAWRPDACEARVRDNAQLNYYFDVPDTWTWLSDVSAWEKHSVVEVADRRLEELKDKSVKPTGQGGRAMLSVSEVLPASLDPDYESWVREWQVFAEKTRPDSGQQRDEKEQEQLDAMRAKIDKAIEDVARLPEVQWLLMSRFGVPPPKDPKEKGKPAKPAKPDPKNGKDGDKAKVEEKPAVAPPTVEVSTNVDMGGRPGIPAAQVKATGRCLNMDGVEADCIASMTVWVVGKKIFRLAIWVWPTEYDYEGLKADIDNIELSYGIPKMTAVPRKAPPPVASDPKDGPKEGETKLGGDADVEKTFTELSMFFKVVKPKGVKSTPIDRTQTAQKNLGFEFRAQSGSADLIIDFHSYTTFEIDPNLADIWKNFLKLHPAGPIETLKFPAYNADHPYLSPAAADPASRKELKRPPDLSKDKPTKADLERMGMIEEVKGAKIGKIVLRQAWRSSLKGVAQRAGEDVQLQYLLQSDERYYVLRIYARGGAYDLMKNEIAAVLKGVSLIEPP
jgi:hypothetical protein